MRDEVQDATAEDGNRSGGAKAWSTPELTVVAVDRAEIAAGTLFDGAILVS